MSEAKRKRPYEARVEYRAVQKEVEKKLAEGYSIRIVYEQLTVAGHLTIGYSSFCDYVRGKGERRHVRLGPASDDWDQSGSPSSGSRGRKILH